jgi:23S rRNA (pseudouridine1915-N3)-methyltransferase
MKIILLLTGKTDKNYLSDGIAVYEKRIVRYLPFEIMTLPDIKNTKNLSEGQQKQLEGEKISKIIAKADSVILLDEHGKTCDSRTFAGMLQQQMNSGIKSLVFVIGGPYGFSEDVIRQAGQKIALSKMTFSHQLVRLLFMEQLYRAFTIINNEPYHHE